MSVRDELEAFDPDFLLAEGFDGALIGYMERCGQPPVALYDRAKCVRVLILQGMTVEEAEEFLEFNVLGAYVGERTPAFATILE